MDKEVKTKHITTKIFRSFITTSILTLLVAGITSIIGSVYLLFFFNSSGKALAATSLSTTLISIINILPLTIGTGIQKRYANHIARGEKDDANRVVSISLVAIVIYSFIFLFVNYFTADILAAILGNNTDQELIQLTSEIIRGEAIGLPFLFFNTAINPIITIDGNKKIINISLIVTILMSVLLSTLFSTIFNKGVFGIALADSLSKITATIVLLFHFLHEKRILSFKCSFKDIKRLGYVIFKGTSATTFYISTALINIYVNYMLLRIGGTSALNIWGIKDIFAEWISNGINAVFSLSYLIVYVYDPEEDLDGMKQLLKILLKFVLIVLTSLCALAIGLHFIIASHFEIEESIRHLLNIAVCVSIGCLIIEALTQILITFMDMKYCILLYFFGVFAFPFVVSLIMTFTYKEIGFYVGYNIGKCVCLFIHLIILLIKYKKIPLDFKKFFYIKESYGYTKDEYIDIRINDINDAFTISNKMFEFLDKHNVSTDKKCMIASCAEEIANIYVMSEFTKDKKKHYCSIRVGIKNGVIKFRTRDDCPFYQEEKNSKIFLSDPCRNISYKILISRAKNIVFTNIFNVNNFTMTI